MSYKRFYQILSKSLNSKKANRVYDYKTYVNLQEHFFDIDCFWVNKLFMLYFLLIFQALFL